MTTPKDAELELLQKEFTSMGNMVFEAVKIACISVVNGKADHLTDVIKRDKVIDGRENTIDKHCIKLWATQAPVAGDLRTIFCIIRSTNELERMGDHAKEITRAIRRALEHGELMIPKTIKNACDEIPELLDQALRAQQDQSSLKARQIRDQAKLGENTFSDLHETFAELVEEGKFPAGTLIEMLDVGQRMQRLYALINNICKNTVFMLEGEIIKHSGREHPLTDI